MKDRRQPLISRGTAAFLLCPYFIKTAEKSENVVSIRQGKGDHIIVRTREGQSIPVPMHREISTGTRWKLIKLFLKAGIIIFVLAYVYLGVNYMI